MRTAITITVAFVLTLELTGTTLACGGGSGRYPAQQPTVRKTTTAACATVKSAPKAPAKPTPPPAKKEDAPVPPPIPEPVVDYKAATEPTAEIIPVATYKVAEPKTETKTASNETSDETAASLTVTEPTSTSTSAWLLFVPMGLLFGSMSFGAVRGIMSRLAAKPVVAGPAAKLFDAETVEVGAVRFPTTFADGF